MCLNLDRLMVSLKGRLCIYLLHHMYGHGRWRTGIYTLSCSFSVFNSAHFPWVFFSILWSSSFEPFSQNFPQIHPVFLTLPPTIFQSLLERKYLLTCLVSISLFCHRWSFIYIVCCGEVSHVRYVLVIMNNSHCGWGWPLWLNLSDPPWVLGGFEFRMNAKESLVLFGVSHDVLKPC